MRKDLDINFEFNEIFQEFLNSKHLIQCLDCEMKKCALNYHKSIDFVFNKFLDIREKKIYIILQTNCFRKSLSGLNNFEKQLLKDFYVRNKTIFYCVENYNLSIRTLFRRKSILIKKILKKYYFELSLIGIEHKNFKGVVNRRKGWGI